VFLDYTPDQQALRAELRRYFAELMTDEIRGRLGGAGEGGPTYRQVIKQLGSDGWLGIGWPAEYGGQGRPPADQFIFFDEAQRAGVPVPFVTLNTVGPTLMRFGSADQKASILPGILSGDLHFAIGYTEPDAGTDLASLRTRAVRDGDDYVIDGSKVFTSGANEADFIWLACRTDPDAPKHRGISILLVPTSSPGFRCTAIHTVGGTRTNATYYDGVRVPATNLVGEENQGWQMITTQLNHERVGLAALGGLAFRLWDEVATYAGGCQTQTGRLVDEPWVQQNLARSFARLEAMKLLNWRLIADTAAGTLKAADASAAKVYGTECLLEVYQLLLEITGSAGLIRGPSPAAFARGDLERAARAAQVNTFGGGVNEVQREILATLGLGLPRAGR
jgi:alkylation response protein AidB-like acyl-CoA dehydrogenase